MPKKIIICPVCLIEKERYTYSENRTYYCSKKCYSLDLKTRALGENNPNFGNTWPKETREKLSIKVRKRYIDNPEYRELSAANKGRKFSEETRRNMSNSQKGRPHKPHTAESKLLIGERTKERMATLEMKLKIRSAHEKAGRWLPLKEMDSKRIYFMESNWVKRMFDIIESEQDMLKLKELKVFHNKKNKGGVIRDHSYTPRSGFLNRVFPEILRHPCNCVLLTHSENISKKDERYIDKDSQTLEELFDKIKSYSKEWFEQEIVLQLIEKYKAGERWVDKYKETRND